MYKFLNNMVSIFYDLIDINFVKKYMLNHILRFYRKGFILDDKKINQNNKCL